MGFDVHGMENFGTRSESPFQTCLNEVRLCKIFIGVLGMKFGSIDRSNDKSLLKISNLDKTFWSILLINE